MAALRLQPLSRISHRRRAPRGSAIARASEALAPKLTHRNFATDRRLQTLSRWKNRWHAVTFQRPAVSLCWPAGEKERVIARLAGAPALADEPAHPCADSRRLTTNRRGVRWLCVIFQRELVSLRWPVVRKRRAVAKLAGAPSSSAGPAAFALVSALMDGDPT